ncbi:MAG: ATP-binding cassette domain-containing protein [Acidimicrobiia bacterium]|nr:ATP-binding cassette domain-containing protein [Acidimicrobiia bacterium]
MAVGLLRPDAATSAVLGADVWAEPMGAKSSMGVLPDGLAMPERLTGREVLTFIGRLRGLDPGLVERRAQELLEVMELTGSERSLVIDYSTGMRKKIGLATALLHNPRLLVLDEPFEAVDPVSASTLKGILVRYVANGGSVVLSSHVMALVEQLCVTVAVMADGRFAASGPLDEVRGPGTLEESFVRLVGGDVAGGEGLSWLGS